MPKKYRGICENCDNYYEGWGAKFCSTKCSINKNREKSLSKIIEKNKKRARPIEKRFWEKVKIGNKNECWEWEGHRLPKGYGTFNNDIIESRLAHRVSYFLYHGEFDQNFVVCHRCDNPPCVNPNHLFLGTQKDNSRDMIEKGRYPTGEKHWNSKITNEQREQIYILLSEGKSNKEIAEMLNIPVTTVSNIKYRG